MSSESLEGLESPEGFNIVVNQPSLSSDGPKSNKPWTYLSMFKVTCQGSDKIRCPVYANGRQQIPIQINIEARDEDGVVVDVNHGRLYLNLVLYDDVEVFPKELGRSGSENSKYIYQWPIGNAPATACELTHGSLPFEDVESTQTVMQFVTANKVGTYKLGARCRSPGWVLFTTTTPNPSQGKFDSWLLIDAREPVPMPWDEFGMSREDAYNSREWDLDLYYIYFKDVNLRIVDSVSYGSAVHDMPHYSWNKGGKQIHHVTYRANERRMVRHRSCADPSNYLNFYVNSRAGQATAARVTDTRPCGSFHSDPRVMGYINQYGNESRVMIKGSSDGNTLHLRDPNSKDEDPVEGESGE